MNEMPAGRRIRLPRISPVKLGLTITGVLLVVFLAWETMNGRWAPFMEAMRGERLYRQPGGILRDFRIAIVHILLAGYLPAALLAVVQTGRRTVFELQGALACSADECEALAASIRLDSSRMAVAGLIGLFIGFTVPYFIPPVPEHLWSPSSWSPEVGWHRVLGPVTAVLALLLIYAVISISARMSRISAGLSSVDLLDLGGLHPFTRQGLTNALLILGWVSISGLMVVTESGFGLLGLFLGVATLVVASAALLLPLRGVHTRIRQAKADELEWLDARILARRDAFLKNRKTGEDSGYLADLLAYRDLVRDVPDWPIGTSSWARFSLYLLIPLLSWAAAALVERFVNSLIS
ncbi:MAG: hypothetical protein P8049_04210 [Gemmatimonadota bacterium]